MNKTATIAVLAVALALGAGYWLGSGAGHPGATAVPAAKERKILFYRNPMGLPDTSRTPKKDSMGMAYIPVYEGEAESGPDAPKQLRIAAEKIQKLGVRTEAASLRDLTRTVRAVGRVEADERLTYTVAPKFDGWIDRLHVNTTGQAVRRGEPLFEAYSPELLSAQQEYAIAEEGRRSMAEAGPEAQAGMKELADASLARMRNWDISADQLQAMGRSGQVRHTLTYRAPVNGIVMEKTAIQGMRFTSGEALYRIADLSTVWIVADLFERDVAEVSVGRPARVRLNAYPGKEFTGTVAFIYPTLNPQTRTVPVRIELANPAGLLKPAMYADVELAAASHGKVLCVPVSAVINGGVRQKVLVEVAEGRFEPRDVKLGTQGADYVEVLQGVGEGESVVVSGNFLIDSESNLKAALAGMTPPPREER